MKFNFKNALMRGTIILTLAGILSRIIGFFYRIFLTRTIGASGMGLFQLVIPIIGIAFALCSAGIQTAVSRFCATKSSPSTWLFAGLSISLPVSCILSFLVYTYADFIASHILMNSDCVILIKILSFTFPFSSFHNCVNGYYFGWKKTGIPAFSQLFEQVIRVLTVFLYSYYCSISNRTVTVICALYGNLAGEIVSTAFCTIALLLDKNFSFKINHLLYCTRKTFTFALPLTANRLLMHLLQSGEVILIPAQLILYGHSKEEALSIYGILTGMALPLILFPSAITNSLSVMLLPEISGAQSSNNDNAITHTIMRSITLCCSMGIISTAVFLIYGGTIASILFNENSVQWFIYILAWLCPFYYLTTTLGSILNGLGKTTLTCIQNIAGIIIRIACLIIFVPKTGISGYLIGLLFSQILVCITHYIELYRTYNISMNVFHNIIIPTVYAAISVGISLIIYKIIINCRIPYRILPPFLGAVCAIAVFCLLSMSVFSKKSNTD